MSTGVRAAPARLVDDRTRVLVSNGIGTRARPDGVAWQDDVLALQAMVGNRAVAERLGAGGPAGVQRCGADCECETCTGSAAGSAAVEAPVYDPRLRASMVAAKVQRSPLEDVDNSQELADSPAELTAGQGSAGAEGVGPLVEETASALMGESASGVLGERSSGPAVVELQTALNENDPAPDPLLVPDGSFGPKTTSAVQAFQTAHGLVPDGLVGPKTNQALFGASAVPEQGPSQCPNYTQAERDASHASGGQVSGFGDEVGADSALLFDFEPGSAEVRVSHLSFLEEITSRFALRRTAPLSLIVAIEGFTDCVGFSAGPEPSKPLNAGIRLRRAQNVKAAVVAGGALPDNVVAEPRAGGELGGIGDTISFNGRARNRAVRISIRDDAPKPEPPDGSCNVTPSTAFNDCGARHDAYCAASECLPTIPWNDCACGVSGQVCQATNAFLLDASTAEGAGMAACVGAPPPVTGKNLREIQAKGRWLLETNACIWQQWRLALDAMRDRSGLPPKSLNGPWTKAVEVCRSAGLSSTECCHAHVEAEQKTIDECGPYDSARFGKLPTDVPGAPLCSFVAEKFGPSPPFTGDFGNVTDRIRYGKRKCCS
jgi:hypothetical protein